MGWGKNDNQGRNKWIKNQWSSKDVEKQQQDQRPETDTWRKPIEEEELALNNDSGIYHDKIVSSMDLAKVFSKLVSNPLYEQSSTQSSAPEHNNQMPFSCLIDARQVSSSWTPRHHINGY